MSPTISKLYFRAPESLRDTDEVILVIAFSGQRVLEHTAYPCSRVRVFLAEGLLLHRVKSEKIQSYRKGAIIPDGITKRPHISWNDI